MYLCRSSKSPLNRTSSKPRADSPSRSAAAVGDLVVAFGDRRGDAVLAQKMSQKLLERGIYVIGFFYPVVPKDKARIRVQISAALTTAELDTAIAAFTKVGKQLSVI